MSLFSNLRALVLLRQLVRQLTRIGDLLEQRMMYDYPQYISDRKRAGEKVGVKVPRRTARLVDIGQFDAQTAEQRWRDAHPEEETESQ